MSKSSVTLLKLCINTLTSNCYLTCQQSKLGHAAGLDAQCWQRIRTMLPINFQQLCWKLTPSYRLLCRTALDHNISEDWRGLLVVTQHQRRADHAYRAECHCSSSNPRRNLQLADYYHILALTRHSDIILPCQNKLIALSANLSTDSLLQTQSELCGRGAILAVEPWGYSSHKQSDDSFP